jgi:hypothetical protein
MRIPARRQSLKLGAFSPRMENPPGKTYIDYPDNSRACSPKCQHEPSECILRANA